MKIKNQFLRYFIILISLAIIFGAKFVPAPSGMTQSMMSVLGIFLGSLILWLTISIDWPSVLCIFALALIPEFNTGSTNGFNLLFKNIFADGGSTIMFLIATFICTYAISKTPLIKRIALYFVSSKFAKRGGWSFIIAFFTASLVLGCFISPTVLFVVLLPILEEILSLAKVEKGEKVGGCLIMGLAFVVSISSGMTPISHVFCVLACNAAKITIDYGRYMLMAVPVGILLTGAMVLMFKLILRPDVSKLNKIDCSKLKEELPKISASEILNLLIFSMVVLMWILPSVLKNANETIMLTIFYAIISLVVIIAFNNCMKAILDIKDEKMAFPSFIFSIFGFIAYISIVINVYLEFVPLANMILLLILLILLVSIVVALIKNIKLPKSNKKMCSLSSFIVVISGILLVFLLNLLFKIVRLYDIFEFIVGLSKYTNAMPPLFGVILLTIISVDGKPLVNLPDAFKNGVPWASIIMCAGTIALGYALTSEAIGLTSYLEVALGEILPNNALVLIIIFALWAAIQTNLSSNMVTATLVATVASTVLGLFNVNMEFVIYIIGMLASFAFATPPSMPHIALAGSSGYSSTKQVLGYGTILMILSVIIAVGVGYPLGLLLSL